MGAALLIAAGVALVTSFTAANTVPPTRAGVTTEPVAPGQFPPTSTLTFPAGGAYGTVSWNLGCAATICGTAKDSAGGTSIANVKVSILGPSGHYWNGTDFNTAASELKLGATGTTSWSLAFPAANYATAGGGDGLYTFKSYATDGSGNLQAPATSATATIDRTGPTNLLTLTAQSPAGSSFKAGNTVYYRGTGGGSGGSFKLRNTVSDAGSGPAASTTAALSGTVTGWTHTPGAVGTPAGGPYDSASFGWGEGTSSAPTETVTASDAAGNATAAAALTFTPDSAAPIGGAITVNGQAASGAGTTSSATSTTVVIAARTDYADAGSGLASSTLTRQSATLTSTNGIAAGTCGVYGTATTIVGTPSQTVTAPACYLFTLTGLDDVGNTAAVSTTVLVDTTPPSAPALVLTAATGDTFVSGTTAYINAQAGKSGGFTAGATATDADTGLLKLSFPTVAGFSAGGGDDTASPYSTVYAWTGAVAAAGAQAVTATNNAALTSSGSFTVTPDTAGPTGGALTVNGQAASGAGTTSYATATTLTIGVRTDYADAGSGLASSLLTRQTATLSSGTGIAAGVCGAFGAATVVTGSPSQSVTGPACYLFTLAGTDNVANVAAISTTVLVDTTPPTTPLLTLSGATGNTYLSGTTVFINPQASRAGGFTVGATTTDADTGILKVTFPALSGFTSGGGSDVASPYSTVYAWSGAVTATGAQTVSATSNAGLTAGSTFAVTPDSSAPSGGALTVNGQAASAAGTASSASATTFTIGTRTDYADAGSGLASSTLTVQSATLTGTTCGAAGSGGAYSVPTTITGTTNPATAAGFCYAYALTGIDRVGNSATLVTTVRVTAAAADLLSVADAVGCASAGCGWAVGTSGTILYTASGSSFQGESSGATADLNGIALSSNNTHVWAVGDGGTILECTTNCQTPATAVWVAQTSNTTANLYSVAAASDTLVWAVGAGGVIDFWNGSSWTVQQSGKSYDLLGIGGTTAGTGWAVGTGGTILVTTNGSTWSAQTAPLISGSRTYTLQAVTGPSASKAWAVGAGGVIVTTANGGTTWTQATSPTTSTLYAIVATGANPSTSTPLFAVGAGGVIVASTSLTAFASQTSPTTSNLYGVASESGTTLWAVGASETVAYTSNKGVTWTLDPPPVVGLSPANGPAGASVTISGSYFAASSALSAKLNGSTVTLGGATATNASGAIAGTTFTVPGSLVSGTAYQLAVTDAAGNRAVATFTAN